MTEAGRSRRRLAATSAIALACVVLALSGRDARAEPTQFWLPYNIQASVTHDWRAALEGQVRWEDHDGDPDLVILRPAVVRMLPHGWSLWAGYGWTAEVRRAGRREHGLWQQVAYAFDTPDWSILPRARIEERFLPDDTLAWRLRAQVRVVRKLRGTPWGVVGWNETWWNLGDAHPLVRSGFDQNRAFGGLQRRMSRFVTLESGYMLQVKESLLGAHRINTIVVTTSARF